jgi:hypothetical protein
MYHHTMATKEIPIERIQTGVRMEKRLVKVLKGLAEVHDMTLGDLLEGIVLHAFEGKAPFGKESLQKIAELKKIDGQPSAHRGQEWEEKIMNDRDFVAALESCSLPSEQFDHRAHVRLAWLYLTDQPLLEALPRFITSLKRYAGSLGASGKYHETITYAFVFLIHERMMGSAATTFEEFAAANEDLFGPILQSYYPKETLASPLARETFILPKPIYEIFR